MRFPWDRKDIPESLRDVYDTPLWQRDFLQDPKMTEQREGLETLPVALLICGDGVQPFKGKQQKGNSLFCLAVSTYNLPPWMREKVGGVLLNQILPGPGEPKDAQPYLDILTDEILYLYEVGIVVYDAHRYAAKAPSLCMSMQDCLEAVLSGLTSCLLAGRETFW